MKIKLRNIAAYLLVVFLISSIVSPASAQDTTPRRAVITTLEGAVLVQAAGQAAAVPARRNMEIKSGDRIITGRDGKAEIRYDDGSTSRIGPNSRVDITNISRHGADGPETTVMNAQRGSVWNNARDVVQRNSRFEVNTPAAIAGVRGTSFLTRVLPTGDTLFRGYSGTFDVGPPAPDPEPDDPDAVDVPPPPPPPPPGISVGAFQQFGAAPDVPLPPAPDPIDYDDVDDFELTSLAQDDPDAFAEAVNQAKDAGKTDFLKQVNKLLEENENMQKNLGEKLDDVKQMVRDPDPDRTPPDPPPRRVRLDAISDLEIEQSKTTALVINTNATSLTAVSSDPALVYVDISNETLYISGAAPGTAAITVTGTRSGYTSRSRTFEVKVTPAAEALVRGSVTLDGGAGQLTDVHVELLQQEHHAAAQQYISVGYDQFYLDSYDGENDVHFEQEYHLYLDAAYNQTFLPGISKADFALGGIFKDATHAKNIDITAVTRPHDYQLTVTVSGIINIWAEEWPHWPDNCGFITVKASALSGSSEMSTHNIPFNPKPSIWAVPNNVVIALALEEAHHLEDVVFDIHLRDYNYLEDLAPAHFELGGIFAHEAYADNLSISEVTLKEDRIASVTLDGKLSISPEQFRELSGDYRYGYITALSAAHDGEMSMSTSIDLRHYGLFMISPGTAYLPYQEEGADVYFEQEYYLHLGGIYGKTFADELSAADILLGGLFATEHADLSVISVTKDHATQARITISGTLNISAEDRAGMGWDDFRSTITLLSTGHSGNQELSTLYGTGIQMTGAEEYVPVDSTSPGADGYYTFEGPAPGAGYLVRASLEGYTAAQSEVFSLTAGEEVLKNLTLSYDAAVLPDPIIVRGAVIKNGRTMLPAKEVFEALGATVSWDAETQVLTATSDDRTIMVQMGSTTGTVNGSPLELDAPARLISGKAFVPLRFTGEAFAADISWDAAEQVVFIKLDQTEVHVFIGSDLEPSASIVIDNHSDAPQKAGLDSAEVVYETSVAPAITRFLAVFDLNSTHQKIGPVRSAREHLVHLAAAHRGVFAHAGGSIAAMNLIPAMPFTDFDEIYNSGAYFYRSSEHEAPHNLYTSSNLLLDGLQAREITTDLTPVVYPRGSMAGGASEAQAVARFFEQQYNVVFDWDGQQYKRYENEEPTYLENGSQVTADNIVIIRAPHTKEELPDLKQTVVRTDLLGQGTATFYRDGKKWTGTWEKNSPEAQFSFYVDGTPYQFSSGNIWILIVPDLAASDDATITSTEYTIDDTAATITDVPYQTHADDFRNHLTLAAGASLDVYEFDAQTLKTDGNITTGDVVIVTAEDGVTTKTYTITVGFAGGDGTAELPYLIVTADHLNNVRNCLEAHFELTADIDLEDFDADGDGKGWEPIGEIDWPAEVEFSGTFNGNGYTISNLMINRPEEINIGLFGGTKGATISNLKVKNADIIGNDFYSESNVGVLIGYADENTHIENVKVTGSVSGSGNIGGLVGFYGEAADTIVDCSADVIVTGNRNVGGLVGHLMQGKIERSYASGEVRLLEDNNARNFGGLVGRSHSIELLKSYATGDVIASSAANVGGLVGRTFNNSTIENSYATGNVFGSEYVGGLVGRIDDRSGYESSVINSYSVGNVTGTASESTGGLVGDRGDSEFYNSYWDITTSGQASSDGGERKTSAQMQDINTFLPNWNFNEIWGINADENSGYPFLRWQGYEHIDPIAYQFEHGSGTAADPFEIWTLADLNGVRDHMAAHFMMMTDLDLEGANFVPLGHGAVIAIDEVIEDPFLWDGIKFTGSFNGNSFQIKNGLVDYPVAVDLSEEDFPFEGFYIGIFAWNEGTVKNVGILNVDINGTFGVGGLAGINFGTITNCYSTGNVTGTMFAGGLTGSNGLNYVDFDADQPTGEGTISNSYTTGNVHGRAGIGGLAGASIGDITCSFATGNVNLTETIDFIEASGGLVGLNAGIIANSYATGDVHAGYGIGGLVGRNYQGKLINTYSTGEVSGGNDIGGLVGSIDTGGDYEDINNFWDTDASLQEISAMGEGKTSAEMVLQSTFINSGWDFTIIWAIDEGNSYPYLQWQENENIPYPPDPLAGGDGSIDNPYLVSSIEDFQRVGSGETGEDSEGTWDMDKHYKQTADIDFGGMSLEPVGHKSGDDYIPFQGVYDGNNYSILNFNMTFPDDRHIGLFAFLNSGEIRNLNIKLSTIIGSRYVGGIAGSAPYGNIVNCSVMRSHIEGKENYSNVGGLVGYAGILYSPNLFIENCVSHKNVIKGKNYTGGIAGSARGTRIENCYSTSAVTATGIYSHPNMGAKSFCGGIVAHNSWGGEIYNSYSAGPLSAADGNPAGISAFYSWNSPLISGCYWNTETTGSEYTYESGAGISTTQMMQQSTFSGWDFSDVWQIDENQSFPYFQSPSAVQEPPPAAPFTFAVASAFTVAEGGSYSGAVSATNEDGVTFALLNGPAHGTLTFDPDGSFSYQATAGFSGTDRFDFVANDGT